MRKLKIQEINRLSPEEFIKTEKFPITVVLDNIRSGHNAGSFFRTADALKIKEIWLCGITSTPPDKEIHKTALGAEESVAWRYFKNTTDAIQELKASGVEVWSVEQTERSTSLPNFMFSGSQLALVFGNEVKGVEQDVLDMCKDSIEIPQFGTKHSINVSVCGGIVLWHIIHQFFL